MPCYEKNIGETLDKTILVTKQSMIMITSGRCGIYLHGNLVKTIAEVDPSYITPIAGKYRLLMPAGSCTYGSVCVDEVFIQDGDPPLPPLKSKTVLDVCIKLKKDKYDIGNILKAFLCASCGDDALDMVLFDASGARITNQDDYEIL